MPPQDELLASVPPSKTAERGSKYSFHPDIVIAFLFPFSATVGYQGTEFGGEATAVAFSPDGGRVAASAKAALVWDLPTARELWRYTLRSLSPDHVSFLAFTPKPGALGVTTYRGAYSIPLQELFAEPSVR